MSTRAILAIEAPSDAARADFAQHLGRSLALYAGDLDQSVEGVLIAHFPSAEAALACARDLRRSPIPTPPRVALHWENVADPVGPQAAARCIPRLPAAALFVSDSFVARLPDSVRPLFHERIVLDHEIYGFVESSRPPDNGAPSAGAPGSELKEAVSEWATSLRDAISRRPAEPPQVGVRSVLRQALHSALDTVERSLTRPPTQRELVDSIAESGVPLTTPEIADLHHLNYGKTRKLLRRAAEEGYLRHLPDGTYLALTEDERQEWLLDRQRGHLHTHIVTYTVVNTGLVVVNLLTTAGSPFWAAIPLVGWGIGLALHARHYLAERNRHRKRLREAERAAAVLAQARSRESARLPSPWGDSAAAAGRALEEIDDELLAQGEGARERHADLLDEYDATVRQLAEQGARLDRILSRFDRDLLREELAAAQASVDADPAGAVHSGHQDRVDLLAKQIDVLEALDSRRESILVKLKNACTLLENLALELSRQALENQDGRAADLFERGARDLAQYRSWAREAMDEVERLLKE